MRAIPKNIRDWARWNDVIVKDDATLVKEWRNRKNVEKRARQKARKK